MDNHTPYRWLDSILELHVVIQANARVNAWCEQIDDRIKIKICAPAVDNKANQQLIKFVAKEFQVAKSRVTIIKGHKSRQKTLHIQSPPSKTLPF